MTTDRTDDVHADAAEAEGMTEGEAAEVAEIRADIEDTREEMGGTLTELGDRLEPGHLVNQVKENVREATIGRVEETAKGVSEMVMDTIKRNPVPAALAGAGLALLWANRSQGPRSSTSYGTGYGYQSRPATMYEGPAQGIGSKARDAASTVTGAVGSVAEGAQQATGEVIDRAGETAQQVGFKLDSFMQASPLALGAVAIGAGAVLGSILPETSQERQVLGDASRQVTSAVRDGVEQATTKAEETLDRAEEKVSSPA
ncbi:MAG TPA: DUF3618 domain-containing protein [Candidatus Limnocylindrales bacterium]|nr:DUF3618 domain-containing protein [Candidatus Limnocylindrales bacterium]